MNVLIRLDSWNIVQDGDLSDNFRYYVEHTPCKDTSNHSRLCWIHNEKPAVCYYCKQDIPDEVVTLIVFLNEK